MVRGRNKETHGKSFAKLNLKLPLRKILFCKYASLDIYRMVCECQFLIFLLGEFVLFFFLLVLKKTLFLTAIFLS